LFIALKEIAAAKTSKDTMVSIQDAQSFVDKFNDEYQKKHKAFEDQFWGNKVRLMLSNDASELGIVFEWWLPFLSYHACTNEGPLDVSFSSHTWDSAFRLSQMNLKSTNDITYNAENLSKTKIAMEGMLADPQRRLEAERLRQGLPADAPTDLVKTLDIVIRTCNCYDMSSSPEAKAIRDETGRLESELETLRNKMNLGYTKPDDKTFVKASSVALRNMMRTSDDEQVRKAAFEGLNSIGPFVLQNGFLEIIKLRNKMAKKLGYIDYYDYKGKWFPSRLKNHELNLIESHQTFDCGLKL